MKNVQVIDGAANATFSVFQATEEEFAAIFPDGRDIELVEDLFDRLGEEVGGAVLTPLWRRPILKRDALGIHGTLFYDNEHRRDHIPLSKREIDYDNGAVNQFQRDLFAKHRYSSIPPSVPFIATTPTLLAAFAARANRPLAQRQLAAGTKFALGRRDGPYIWNLENTHRLLDCATTGGVHSLGHRNPELLEALRSALDAGYDGGIWTMPNAPLLALHDALAACAPKWLDRSVVTLCASQANDLALLCAFRTTGRRGIVAARHGYHGHLGVAAEATGSESEGIASHYAIPRTNVRFFHHHGDLPEICALIDETTAAVILEPFDYESWQLPPPDFLPALAEFCRQRGAKLILDETRTGLARSGRMWLCEFLGATPDMLVSGKGLSGGLYPVGALLMTQAIHEACINSHEYGWANSLAGNEIAATVALKVLEITQRPDTRANIAAIEARIRQRFGELARRHQSVFTPSTMMGGIATIGLVQPAHATRLSKLMFDHGVLMHSVSTTPPYVAKFLPILTADPAIIDELASALDRVAQQLNK